AVIVGLARASQTGPAIKRRRDDSRQIAMMEPTRQMAGEDARRMLERMEAERREREVSEAREAERRLREPRLPMGPGPGRGPSRQQQQLEDGPTELAPLHLEDEDTHDVGLSQARSLVAEARPHQQDARRDNAFEEPTRAVDWGTMDDLARGSPPGGRRPPGPPPGMRSERAPRGEPPLARPGPGPMTRGPDEDTRSVDLKRVVSLSEIDWDLD
ncbi:MAG TPA: hypothetical protein VNO33_03585, partial [Kofleriaceae bacterium]|nr:hypothetical protein [Kofleriaceae bacterium]